MTRYQNMCADVRALQVGQEADYRTDHGETVAVVRESEETYRVSVQWVGGLPSDPPRELSQVYQCPAEVEGAVGALL